jgi:hypothetical protein
MEPADDLHDPQSDVPAPPFAIRRLGPCEQGVLMLLETKTDGDRTADGDHAARLHRHGRKRRGGGHGH